MKAVPTNKERLLHVKGLTKSFNDLRALDDVDLTIEAGEVVGLLGHNGSGKSTLVKVLAGIHMADPGSMIEVNCGIHFIHQDLGMIPMLNTVENLSFDGRRGLSTLAPSRKSEIARAQMLIRRLGADFDVTVPLSQLSPAQWTIVAIARATANWTHERNLLVLDEPTATLHGDEAAKLHSIVQKLAAEGTGIIYISHHLEEVVELSDRAVVLRDGKVILNAKRGQFDRQSLVAAISGKALLQTKIKEHRAITSEPVLEVQNLVAKNIRQLDLQVRAGEIVGIAGLIGSGMENALGAIFGASPRDGGHVSVAGKLVRPSAPKEAIREGLAYLPADRRRHGAVLSMSARENLTLSSLRDVTGSAGLLIESLERARAKEDFENFQIKPFEPERKIALFSGGNQQKVLIAKWLRTVPKVLMFDEPTQGVDVGAKESIYEHIRGAAAKGAAILIATSDEEELAAICDRVLVLERGAVIAEIVGKDVTEANIIHACLGEVS